MRKALKVTALEILPNVFWTFGVQIFKRGGTMVVAKGVITRNGIFGPVEGRADHGSPDRSDSNRP